MYREERTMWWSWAIGIAAVAATGSVAWIIVEILRKGKPVPPGAVVALASGSLGLLVVWWATFAFWRYLIELDRGWFTFGFRLWSVSLPVTELVRAERFSGSLLRFGGLGWRLGPKRQIGYLADFGPAVAVTTAAGRTYVLSCRDPDRLLQELAAAGVDCGTTNSAGNSRVS